MLLAEDTRMHEPRVRITYRILFGLAALTGCGTGTHDSTFVSELLSVDASAPTDDSGGLFRTFSDAEPCTGIACQRAACGDQTTVTGTVYDPAGRVPLYNVVTYVPNAKLDPIHEGATCDRCGASLSGDPIVTALTNTEGRFVLKNVPVGKDIPLVIQVGKWRRQIRIPEVKACVENPLTNRDETRLPARQSEGDMPQLALTTGGADPLECLLRKIGIHDSEFTLPNGSGKVHLFAARGGASKYAPTLHGGAPFPSADTLWDTEPHLKAYDVALLACEGRTDPDGRPQSYRQALYDYVSHGGRVFASHWHHYWLEGGPAALQSSATFQHQEDLADPYTADIDTSFPKGAALADWLSFVGATPTKGQLVIREAQHTVTAVNPEVAQAWISSPGGKDIRGRNAGPSVQYFSLNAPVGAPVEAQCGRMVVSDIHVSSGDTIGAPFPTGCRTKELSAQEKALEFMLFDLSSCVQKDSEPPVVPVPK